jgi:hypothetical protein
MSGRINSAAAHSFQKNSNFPTAEKPIRGIAPQAMKTR